jgi:hypothetical protein
VHGSGFLQGLPDCFFPCNLDGHLLFMDADFNRLCAEPPSELAFRFLLSISILRFLDNVESSFILRFWEGIVQCSVL